MCMQLCIASVGMCIASTYTQYTHMINTLYTPDACNIHQSLYTYTGPKGEGGLDDATGAGGRGGAGYTQTSKAVDLGTQ